MKRVERLLIKVSTVNEALLNENTRMITIIEELEEENIKLQTEVEDLRETLRIVSLVLERKEA